MAWWCVALKRGLVGLWLLAMDSRWLDLLDLRLTCARMSAFGSKADIDQPLLTNLDLLVHGLVRSRSMLTTP